MNLKLQGHSFNTGTANTFRYTIHTMHLVLIPFFTWTGSHRYHCLLVILNHWLKRLFILQVYSHALTELLVLFLLGFTFIFFSLDLLCWPRIYWLFILGSFPLFSKCPVSLLLSQLLPGYFSSTWLFPVVSNLKKNCSVYKPRIQWYIDCTTSILSWLKTT